MLWILLQFWKNIQFQNFQQEIILIKYDQLLIIKLISLKLQMTSYQNIAPYNPFKYPPDYRLARLHQTATMPGKPDRSNNLTCPCCSQSLKVPFKSWWSRSIPQDFNKFGGAVVSYFWLLKLYFIAALILIVIYGGYLHYLSDYYCGIMEEGNRKDIVCSKLFGIWIISNQDLNQQIKQRGDQSTQVRYFTLRTIAFLVLLATNCLSLYIVRWFKICYPPKVSISSFSVLFKNLKSDNISDLIDNLKVKIGEFGYKQAFIIKKVQPYYSMYQEKLQCYYLSKIEESPKKLKKLCQKLNKLDIACGEAEEKFYNFGNRAIIVFEDLETTNKVLQIYKVNACDKLQMFFSNHYEEQFGIYSQKCPKVQEIIWNNIGVIERQGFKMKILSVLYFILLLVLLVSVLYFALKVIYLRKLEQPYHTIFQNILLIVLVPVALTFRALMNKLSEMRFPSTFSRRTLFIIVTTVFFHFIFYLLIPSGFLRFWPQNRSSVLNLISNQSATFITFQIIFAACDIMYCCWNRKKGEIENQNKPVGCQKILHQKMQYPRFPIQFKLIILFKIWSLTTFFAFHVPLVLFMIAFALLFLYIKDKMNLYYHYRMEIIDNSVQFKFLRIYSSIFTLYLYEIFVFTQNDKYEFIIGTIVTISVLIFQIVYFRKIDDEEITKSESFIFSTFLEIAQQSPYKANYQRFLERARSEVVDNEIKDYLSRQGYGTMDTEDSSGSQVV